MGHRADLIGEVWEVLQWSMEWILRGSGSQYDLISRAGALTGLMLLFTTVVALMFNKTKREQVLADLKKPFECAPHLQTLVVAPPFAYKYLACDTRFWDRLGSSA
jgi:hypothetical protein